MGGRCRSPLPLLFLIKKTSDREIPIHAIAGIPLRGRGIRVDVVLEELAIHPCFEVDIVDRGQCGPGWQRLLSLISENDLAMIGLLTRETAFVHEVMVMVMSTQQHEIVETRVTAIGPVLDVMSIDESVVRAARKTASLVAKT